MKSLLVLLCLAVVVSAEYGSDAGFDCQCCDGHRLITARGACLEQGYTPLNKEGRCKDKPVFVAPCTADLTPLFLRSSAPDKVSFRRTDNVIIYLAGGFRGTVISVILANYEAGVVLTVLTPLYTSCQNCTECLHKCLISANIPVSAPLGLTEVFVRTTQQDLVSAGVIQVLAAPIGSLNCAVPACTCDNLSCNRQCELGLTSGTLCAIRCACPPS